MENLTIMKILALIVCILFILAILKIFSGMVKTVALIIFILVALYLMYRITIDFVKIYNNTEQIVNDQYQNNNIFKEFIDAIKNGLLEIKKIFTNN